MRLSTGPADEDAPLTDPTTARRDSVAVVAQRIRPRLLASAARVLSDVHEAEDAVQQVLVKATHTRGIEAPEGWLFAATYRAALDRVRARARRTRLAEGATASAPEAPDELAEARERARRVRAAVEALDEPYRTALTLRYLEGLSFPEVARRMDALERTTRTWVGRGLTRLRARLGDRP